MQLGEIAPGGTGSGLYGMLILAVITVFVAGLMVGRTPEYLKKKIRGREMEQDIPTAYLSRLNALYESWFEHYKMSPVLVLPTDKLDYLTDLVDRADLFRQIEKHL